MKMWLSKLFNADFSVKTSFNDVQRTRKDKVLALEMQ